MTDFRQISFCIDASHLLFASSMQFLRSSTVLRKHAPFWLNISDEHERTTSSPFSCLLLKHDFPLSLLSTTKPCLAQCVMSNSLVLSGLSELIDVGKLCCVRLHPTWPQLCTEPLLLHLSSPPLVGRCDVSFASQMFLKSSGFQKTFVTDCPSRSNRRQPNPFCWTIGLKVSNVLDLLQIDCQEEICSPKLQTKVVIMIALTLKQGCDIKKDTLAVFCVFFLIVF